MNTTTLLIRIFLICVIISGIYFSYFHKPDKGQGNKGVVDVDLVEGDVQMNNDGSENIAIGYDNLYNSFNNQKQIK